MSDAASSASPSDSQLQDRAFDQRRLGALILENKDGAALQAAIPHFTEAAAIWEKLHWPVRQAEILCDLGRVHAKAHDDHHASEAYTKAQRLFAGADDVRSVDAGIAGANAWLTQGRADAALALLKDAAVAADKHNDHLRLAGVRLELGRALVVQGDAVKATEAAELALKTFTDYRQWQQVAAVHELTARAHALANRLDESTAAWERAVKQHQDLGRPLEAGECLARWADHAKDRGDTTTALAALERGLALHRHGDKKAAIAQMLRRIGSVHLKRKEFAEARARYSESLELSRTLEDQEGISRSLYLLGAAEVQAKRLEEGQALIEESLAAAEKLGLQSVIEPALAALARVLRARGDHDRAIEVMNRWVTVLKDLGDRQDALQVLGTIAELHQERGAWFEAEAHLDRLLQVANRPEDQTARARALALMATVKSHNGSLTEAKTLLRAAIDQLPAITPERTRARLSYRLGSLLLVEASGHGGHQPDGDLAAESLSWLQRAEHHLTHEDDDQARAKVLVAIGNAKALLGQVDEAKTVFDEAADLCEKQGDVRSTRIIRKATLGL